MQRKTNLRAKSSMLFYLFEVFSKYFEFLINYFFEERWRKMEISAWKISDRFLTAEIVLINHIISFLTGKNSNKTKIRKFFKISPKRNLFVLLSRIRSFHEYVFFWILKNIRLPVWMYLTMTKKFNSRMWPTSSAALRSNKFQMTRGVKKKSRNNAHYSKTAE